jgi:hypothetical protein
MKNFRGGFVAVPRELGEASLLHDSIGSDRH